MSYAPEQNVVDRAVEIRRDLHMHPELGYEEHRTHDLIVDELERLGVAHAKGLAGGTGVLGWLPGRDERDAIDEAKKALRVPMTGRRECPARWDKGR